MWDNRKCAGVARAGLRCFDIAGNGPVVRQAFRMGLGPSGATSVVHSFAGRKGWRSWRDNGCGVCGAVRATMVVQFAMGAMVLDQCGRGFGAAA